MAENASDPVHSGGDDGFWDKPRGRREVVGGLGLSFLAIATGVVVLAGLPEDTPSDVQEGEAALVRSQQNQAEMETAQALAQNISEGMRRAWTNASVWPGLAIVPPHVPLFTTPSLHPDTQLPWPGDANHKLIMQRPFLIAASMQLNNQPAPGGVHQQIMGGWLPKSEQIVYFDRWTHMNHILLPTVSRASTYDESGMAVGEPVKLEPAVTGEDLTWRYLLSDYIVTSYYPNDVFNRVCGRSLMGNIFEVNRAIDYYSGGYHSVRDLITLPKETHA
ncbi:MAG TPA: hypothetical protein VM124_00815 [Candidatus Limnocylindrales bacterium]|nr:hypothetical protein [Candidatus Limnocylindrales bacterium]